MRRSAHPLPQLARARSSSSLAVALCALCACGSPSNNSALFAASGAHATTNAAGSNSAGETADPGAAGTGGTGTSSAGSADAPISGEPFDYAAWSAGQPNASKTSCGESNGGGDCYEHCGFQWTGGEHDGQWNDRYCLHTIESVCEWDQ